MTGAGSATVAYALEQEYGGPLVDEDSDGTPEWFEPGTNTEVTDLTVEQALERSRRPSNPLPIGSREGNFEGALGVTFTLTDANWHDLVFADGGTALPTEPMAAPSSTWYLAVQLPDGTTESRTPTGAIVTDATISYEQGSAVQVELTMLYGDEPSDVTEPADADIQMADEAAEYSWHGASFDVDGLGQSLMQTASLSLSGLARFRRGQSRHPYDAVVGAVEPSFSTDATFTERDQLALAVDDVVASSYEEVGKVPAELGFENGLGDTITYSLPECQPNTYGWNGLTDAGTDLSEPIDYHVAGAITAEEVTA